jgi:hypothetical protein
MAMLAMESSLPPSPADGSAKAPMAPSIAQRNLDWVRQALNSGMEVGIGGTWLRLFQAGDVIRTPRGFYETDAPRLMYRVVKGMGRDSVYTDSAFESDVDIWHWLENQAALLSEECISKIAATCGIHELSRQEYPAPVVTGNVVAFRPHRAAD